MSTIKKCPLCGKKLISKSGIPTCPDCGYRAAYDEGTASVNSSSVNGSLGNNSSGNSTSADPVEKAQKKMARSAIVSIIICAVLAISICIGVFIINKFMKPLESGNSKDTPKQTEKQTEKHTDKNTAESKYDKDETESSHKTSINDITSAPTQESNSHSGYRPESDMMIELVELIFDKELEDITRDELDSIVYLDFYDLDAGGVAVYFELADGTSATCFMESSSVDTTDLKCFRGLECLLLEDESLDFGTDWTQLKELYLLQCGSSLSELASAMDVSQLYGLILDSGLSLGSNGMKDIAEYTNLAYLQLDASYIDSLTGLSSAPSLTELYISDGDGISDFEELYNMPNLEVLYIESSGLRDIGFVSSMNNLNDFEIYNTSVKKLDALSDCVDTLTCLRLHQNYQIEDYSIVFECTGLEELELYVDYNFDVPMEVPDLSMMTNLKKLSIGNYDCFSNMKNIPWIEDLTICDVYSADAQALEGLTNLTSLTLLDMSITPEFLEPLADASNLTYLDMNGTFFWGDFNVIMDIPNLTTLYLTDADVGLMPADVPEGSEQNRPVCDTLQLLDLKGTTFHVLNEDGSWNYGESQTITPLTDNMEFFDMFPNLEMLYVPGHELDDLSFTSGMSKLYYLDITDNYINDLSPLQALTSLEVLICPNNPIHDRTGLDEIIIIE